MKTATLINFFAAFFLCLPAAAQHNNNLVFMSDTQEPMWIETLKLKTEHNKEATAALFANLSQQQFAALFLLGDMVSSNSDDKWQHFDKYVASITNKNIPVYATIGNHEYMFRKSSGIKQFVARFGYQATIGFAQTIDSVSVVLLNSNFGKLTDKEKQQQIAWYMHAMDSLERAHTTKTIIVCTHHSPYTNSTIISASKEVENRFVPKFLRTSKAKLFLSGHSHNLEHFAKDDKQFLVIGGGGGLEQPLKIPEKSGYNDLLSGKPKLRFFYLVVKRDSNKLTVEAHGFVSDNFSEPIKVLPITSIE